MSAAPLFWRGMTCGWFLGFLYGAGSVALIWWLT